MLPCYFVSDFREPDKSGLLSCRFGDLPAKSALRCMLRIGECITSKAKKKKDTNIR